MIVQVGKCKWLTGRVDERREEEVVAAQAFAQADGPIDSIYRHSRVRHQQDKACASLGQKEKSGHNKLAALDERVSLSNPRSRWLFI